MSPLGARGSSSSVLITTLQFKGPSEKKLEDFPRIDYPVGIKKFLIPLIVFI